MPVKLIFEGNNKYSHYDNIEAIYFKDYEFSLDGVIFPESVNAIYFKNYKHSLNAAIFI